MERERGGGGGGGGGRHTLTIRFCLTPLSRKAKKPLHVVPVMLVIREIVDIAPSLPS